MKVGDIYKYQDIEVRITLIREFSDRPTVVGIAATQSGFGALIEARELGEKVEKPSIVGTMFQLKGITSGYWDQFNTNDEINAELGRDEEL